MKTANFPRSIINETYGEFPFVVGDDDWLISIADIGAYNTAPKVKFGNVLFMNFADVEFSTPNGKPTRKALEKLAMMGAMTGPQAQQIAEFIREARALKKNVWVNCHAGMCRSGAVVRLLLELGWEEAKYPGQPTRVPNLLVYDRVRKHFPELSQSWDCVVSMMDPNRLQIGDVIADSGAHGTITNVFEMEDTKTTIVTVKWDYSGEEETYDHNNMNFYWYGQ